MRLCFDRIIHDAGLTAAVAVELSAANAPSLPPLIHPGAFDLDGDGVADGPPSPLSLALLTSSRWPNGHTIRVAFLDGPSQAQEEALGLFRVWSRYASIDFAPASNPREADCRVSFRSGSGSWSYLGTGSRTIPYPQPTMTLGWFVGANDREKSRVAVHEAGHLLSLIHEHQNPADGIKWNKEAVYRTFGSPPNNWSRREVDQQIFDRYAEDQTWHTKVDPVSIMMYEFLKPLVEEDLPGNWTLSELDKESIALQYPGRGTPTPPKPTDPPVPPQPPTPSGPTVPLTPGSEAGARSRILVPGQPAVFRVRHDRPGVRLHLEVLIRNSMGRLPVATIAPVGSPAATRLKFVEAGIIGGGVAHRIKAPAGEYEVRVLHPYATLTGPVWLGAWYDSEDRPWGQLSA